jgi:hypothetical protein
MLIGFGSMDWRLKSPSIWQTTTVTVLGPYARLLKLLVLLGLYMAFDSAPLTHVSIIPSDLPL